MKKIALIDNMQFSITQSPRWVGFKRSLDIFNSFKKSTVLEIKTVRFDDIERNIKEGMVEYCDGYILSGSNYRIDDYNTDAAKKKMFEEEIKLIKSVNKPVLGICFGMQAVGISFGCKIEKCKNEEKGVIVLDIDPSFPIYSNDDKIIVEMSHRRGITDDEDFKSNFNSFSSNENCNIQAIVHKKKKIYGVQFHPETNEMIAIMNGITVLCNFFNIVTDGVPFFSPPSHDYFGFSLVHKKEIK